MIYNCRENPQLEVTINSDWSKAFGRVDILFDKESLSKLDFIQQFVS